MIAKGFASSEHWYTRDGEPAYTVKGKDGERPTTLRDARKLSLIPSVTSILNVASKPGLEKWKQQQLLLAALTLPKIDSESEDQYIDRIIRDSKEQGKAAADAGTEIHASIEAFYRGRTVTLLVATSPGGRYDVNARLIARHAPRYIPGAPSIVVESMPGAAGMTSVNYVAKVGVQDGTIVGVPGTAPFFAPLTAEAASFPDPRQLQWLEIGRAHV